MPKQPVSGTGGDPRFKAAVGDSVGAQVRRIFPEHFLGGDNLTVSFIVGKVQRVAVAYRPLGPTATLLEHIEVERRQQCVLRLFREGSMKMVIVPINEMACIFCANAI